MSSEVNQEQRAFLAWNVLIEVASAKSIGITYSDLGKKVGIHHRAVRHVLGKVQDYCLENKLPPLTILVINKGTSKPGGGFIAWDVDNADEGIKQVHEYNWKNLKNPFKYADDGMTINKFVKQLIDQPNTSSEVYAKVKVRGAAQQVFRGTILSVYNNKCCVCGLSFKNILEASHIIPYSIASDEQKLEVSNGLLLCANHHKMFDNGYITLNEDYTIKYSDIKKGKGEYTEFDKLMTVNFNGKKISLPKRIDHQPKSIYLKQHQDSFSKK